MYTLLQDDPESNYLQNATGKGVQICYADGRLFRIAAPTYQVVEHKDHIELQVEAQFGWTRLCVYGKEMQYGSSFRILDNLILPISAAERIVKWYPESQQIYGMSDDGEFQLLN